MGERITTMERGMQRRTELLLGESNLDRIRSARVIVFGVGGVGSWCAEGLVRSGIRNITIVDSDRVCVTNCNRQLLATSRTVGRVKVEVMRERLLEINPDANVTALQTVYSAESADSFHLEQYDYIVDAIDSLKDKADLILRATSLPKSVTLVSSMGAALKRDPLKVRKAEFWKVTGDPLARALRKKFKHNKVSPGRKFQCVYSEELPMENLGSLAACGTPDCICHNRDGAPGADSWAATKAQTNGSLCQVTAVFGMAITSIIINHILDKE